MFGLFKRKTEKEKLQEQYAKLMKEAHRLSTIDRAKSDLIAAKAEQVALRMESI